MKATSQSAILCVRVGAIKGNVNVLPAKTARIACLGNYSFEFLLGVRIKRMKIVK